MKYLGRAIGKLLDWQAEQVRPRRGRHRARLTGPEWLEDRSVPAALEFNVNTLADTPDDVPGNETALDAAGNTSLRAAIMAANDNDPGAGSHVINLTGVTGTITLATELPWLNRNIFINNNDRTALVVERGGGAANFRLFRVLAGHNCVIGGLTLRNGNATGANAYGGAILNEGNLTVSGCAIIANGAASGGGGIANKEDPILLLPPRPQLTLIDTIMQNNWAVVAGASGGAVWSKGFLDISNCTFSGNQAMQAGGAIYNEDEVFIRGSTISNNHTVNGNGGGIYSDGKLTMENSTIASNRCQDAAAKGGGIYAKGAVATLTSCIIQDNQASNGRGVWWVLGTPYTEITCTIINNDVVGGPA